MNWYLKCLKQYADFSGRARRKEYWMFVLFNIIFATIAMILDKVSGITIAGVGFGPIVGLYVLILLIPGLAVTIRRLHDVGKNGWFIVIGLIPVVGTVWLLVLLCMDSEPNENEYGANPKILETNDSTAEQLIFIYIVLAFINRSFTTMGPKINNKYFYSLFEITNEYFTLMYGIIPIALAFIIRNRLLRIVAILLSGLLFLFRLYRLMGRV